MATGCRLRGEKPVNAQEVFDDFIYNAHCCRRYVRDKSLSIYSQIAKFSGPVRQRVAETTKRLPKGLRISGHWKKQVEDQQVERLTYYAPLYTGSPVMIEVDNSIHSFELCGGSSSQPFFVDKAQTIKCSFSLGADGKTFIEIDSSYDSHLSLMFRNWFLDAIGSPTDPTHKKTAIVEEVKNCRVEGHSYPNISGEKVKICCQIDAAWTRTEDFIPLKLATTFDEQKFMDCKVQYGEKSAWASKYILMGQSEEFFKQLAEPKPAAEKRKGKKGSKKAQKALTATEAPEPITIQIEGFDDTAVLDFLKYLHSDGIIFPDHGHENLYRIAKRYAISSLIKRCSNKLCSSIDEGNFAKRLVFSFEEEVEELKVLTLVFVHKDSNKKVFVSSDEFSACVRNKPDVAISIFNALVDAPPTPPEAQVIDAAEFILTRKSVPNKYMDFMFKVNRNHIYASKFVLAAHSNVFAAMFASGFEESTSGVATICDADVATARNMVDFLHCGLFPEDGLEELYTIADKYNIASLMERSLIEMCKGLNEQNFAKRLIFTFQLNHEELKRFILKFAQSVEHTKQFFHSAEFSQLMAEDSALALEICQALH